MISLVFPALMLGKNCTTYCKNAAQFPIFIEAQVRNEFTVCVIQNGFVGFFVLFPFL